MQHMLHQIKAPQFYTDLGLQNQRWILLQMVKFMDFSRPLSVLRYFSRQILFSRTFQDSLVYSSTFQACANPDTTDFASRLTHRQMEIQTEAATTISLHICRRITRVVVFSLRKILRKSTKNLILNLYLHMYS